MVFGNIMQFSARKPYGRQFTRHNNNTYVRRQNGIKIWIRVSTIMVTCCIYEWRLSSTLCCDRVGNHFWMILIRSQLTAIQRLWAVKSPISAPMNFEDFGATVTVFIRFDDRGGAIKLSKHVHRKMFRVQMIIRVCLLQHNNNIRTRRVRVLLWPLPS